MTIATRLNDKQRERIARNIVGYQGPMSGFNKFLESDQVKKSVYNNAIAQIDQKMAVKMASGGTQMGGEKFKNPNAGGVAQKIEDLYQETFNRPATVAEQEFYQKEFGDEVDSGEAESLTKRLQESKGPDTPAQATAPIKPQAERVEAAKIQTDPRQDVKFEKIEDVKTVTPAVTTPAEKVDVPDARDVVTMDVEKVTPKAEKVIEKIEPVKGEVSTQAQVQAQTVDATATAIKNVQAANIEQATQIDSIPKRKLQAEELVQGPSVKSAVVEQNLEKFQAAQMELDPKATIQGQLEELTKNFDAKNPPAWAAGALRSATAVLNQRGLGASSVAGQAVVQAIMESALPIAQQDAQTIFNLGLQNLSNRQQRATIAAQQRAQFLGQEFDQAFQARVANASRISDIANQNFNAEVQVTLENARLAQSVDLANLNNRQALVMAEAAQIANLETSNLNNRQQAAVQNAQAFLQMDLTNLQYEQQTQLFKAQERIKAMFTDAAAENASRQFNATSQNQVNQFYDSLANETKRFNVQQENAMQQFNVQQSNAISQFNAQQENAVAQFNASNGLVVSQANAEWRRNIATIDTAAINQTNQFNAQNAMALTVREYEGMWQEYRDKMQFAHDTSENKLDRENQYGIAIMQKDANIEAAKFGMSGQLYQALGALGAAGLSGTNLFKGGGLFSTLTKSITKAIGGRDAVEDLTGTDVEKTVMIDGAEYNVSPVVESQPDFASQKKASEATFGTPTRGGEGVDYITEGQDIFSRIDTDDIDPVSEGFLTQEEDDYLTNLSYGDPY